MGCWGIPAVSLSESAIRPRIDPWPLLVSIINPEATAYSLTRSFHHREDVSRRPSVDAKTRNPAKIFRADWRRQAVGAKDLSPRVLGWCRARGTLRAAGEIEQRTGFAQRPRDAEVGRADDRGRRAEDKLPRTPRWFPHTSTPHPQTCAQGRFRGVDATHAPPPVQHSNNGACTCDVLRRRFMGRTPLEDGP